GRRHTRSKRDWSSDVCSSDLPVNARVPALAAAIDNALGDSVEMVGFDAHAVAIAVRRALGKATGWGDHEFEVIGPEVMDPVMHEIGRASCREREQVVVAGAGA